MFRQFYKQQRPQSSKWSPSEAGMSKVYPPSGLWFRLDRVDVSLFPRWFLFHPHWFHVRPGKQRSDLSPLISLITDYSSCYWNRDNSGTVPRPGTDTNHTITVSCCIMDPQNKSTCQHRPSSCYLGSLTIHLRQ